MPNPVGWRYTKPALSSTTRAMWKHVEHPKLFVYEDAFGTFIISNNGKLVITEGKLVRRFETSAEARAFALALVKGK